MGLFLRQRQQGVSAYHGHSMSLHYGLNIPLMGQRSPKLKESNTNYVTNGYITEVAFNMIAPLLDIYRVDIKGFSEKTYARTGHIKGFKGILDITEKAKKYGMHVECVTNITPKFNDDEKELKDIASWIKNTLGPETPWHVTRFYPQHKLSHLSPTSVSQLEKAWSIGKEEGLWYVYLGNVPGHRLENTYCHSCGELLIERYVFDIIKNGIRDGRCITDCP